MMHETRRTPVALLIALVAVAVAVLHLPLAAALVEYYAARTNRVHGFCERLGINGFLEIVYRPVGWLIAWFV